MPPWRVEALVGNTGCCRSLPRAICHTRVPPLIVTRCPREFKSGNRITFPGAGRPHCGSAHRVGTRTAHADARSTVHISNGNRREMQPREESWRNVQLPCGNETGSSKRTRKPRRLAERAHGFSGALASRSTFVARFSRRCQQANHQLRADGHHDQRGRIGRRIADHRHIAVGLARHSSDAGR